MNFCPTHRAALRQEVDAQGLTAFLSEGTDQAESRAKAMFKEGVTRETYDPLTVAIVSIIVRLQVHGCGELLHYPACPLCTLTDNCGCGRAECGYKRWPRMAAEDARRTAVNLRLVTRERGQVLN